MKTGSAVTLTGRRRLVQRRFQLSDFPVPRAQKNHGTDGDTTSCDLANVHYTRRNQATANGLNLKTVLTRPDEMERPPIIGIDIPALRPGTVGAYAFAFLSAGVALALRLAIDPYVVGIQFVTFFPAVIITTLVSGLGAGLFCLLLSVSAVALFLLPPRFSFSVEDLSDVLTTLLFVLLTFSNVILIAGTRFAMERYQELSRKLEQHDLALREREKRVAERPGKGHPSEPLSGGTDPCEAAGTSP